MGFADKGTAQNNKILHYYVPCYRKSDNEVGLYDIITNTFLVKSGSGHKPNQKATLKANPIGK